MQSSTRSKPLKLIILGDSSSEVSRAFFESFAEEKIEKTKMCKVVATIDFKQNDLVHRLLRIRNNWKYHTFPECFNGKHWTVNKDSINSQRIIEKINRLNVDGAICCGVPCKFNQGLITALKHCINYHNGLLPNYAGVGSLRMAAWNGENETGWTLHVMQDLVDSGNILAQESYLLRYQNHSDIIKIDNAMAKKAAKRLSNMIAEGKFNENGQPQELHNRKYFSQKHWEMTTTVEKISKLSKEEIQKRLTIFGYIRTMFNGKHVYYTSLNPARICYLPTWIYKTVGWAF